MDDLEHDSQTDSMRSLVALIVIMALVLLWSTVIAPMFNPPPEARKAEAEKPTTSAPVAKAPEASKPATLTQAKPTSKAPAAPTTKTAAAPTTKTPAKQPEQPPAPPPKPPGELPLVERRKSSSLFCATFTSEEAALQRLILLDYFLSPLAKAEARRALKADPNGDLSPYGLPLLGEVGGEPSLVLLPRGEQGATASEAAAPKLAFPSRYELVADEERAVAFRGVLPELHLEITKTFRLPGPEDKGQRILTLDVQFRNLGDQPLEVPGYLLRGPGGLAADLAPASWKRGKTVPDEEEIKAAASFLRAAVATETERGQVNVVRESASSVFSQQKKGEPFNREGGVIWSADESNYFTSILDPLVQESQGLKVWSGGARSVGEYNVSANIQVAPFTLAPSGAEGDRALHRYRLYAGPKTREDLAPYDASFEKVIESHWYDPLSSIMIWILRGSYAVIPNYGIAIIILTIVVRLVLHPLSRKSQTSMAKMQKLQPQMQEMREKYKNDKQRQQQEMMKLYKEYGVNPLGGCLPMLLQLPVFIGLYNMLRMSIELRQAAFIPWWIEDLSQPDALFGLVNVLPVLSTVIMFIQQRMTPKSPDPQQQQTQKIMGYMMPVFLGFIFYNMPAGLNLYFIASMLIGVFEQRHIKRQLDKLGDLKPVERKTPKQTRKAVLSRAAKTPKRKLF